jgi:pimeloyl-ACP methyl ester carboxylesterase
MARPVDAVSSAHVDAIRFDDVSFRGTHGEVGVTVFMPSARQVGVLGQPEIICPYSAGWGEGLGAARTACEALVRSANAMAVTIEYPKKRLAIHDIQDFRTEVFGEVLRHLAEDTVYDFATPIVTGYSRGTAPARLAAVEHADVVSGVVLVAPTWFPHGIRPHELASRGIAEGAGAMARTTNWLDRFNLVGASMRLAQEMLAHPIELRNDIAAISQESAADLADLLDTGLVVGVVAGIEDELCQIDGIRGVVDKLPDRSVVDFREVHSDHFSYFMAPGPLAVVADVVRGLADTASSAA